MNESTPKLPNRAPYNWRLLLVLVAAMLLSTILCTPYALTIQEHSLKDLKLPLPLAVLIPIEWMGGTLLCGTLAAIGLAIASRIGLGLPFLEGWLLRKPDWPYLRRLAWRACLAGVLVSLAVIIIQQTVFDPRLSAEFKARLPHPHVAKWKWFLASFYGGITEETIMRLFLLSLLVWVGRFVNRTSDGRPGCWALWMANLLAAVLFGLGHLPAFISIGVPIDAVVVTRAIVLNGLGGIVFGWLFWTYGLEAAIVAHFSADITLHILWPLQVGS